MLRFLFGSKTKGEQDDTRSLHADLCAAYEASGLDDTALQEDVAAVMGTLLVEADIDPENLLTQNLEAVLTDIAGASDLYGELEVATDVFIDDLDLDVENRARMSRKISLYQHADKNRERVRDSLYAIGSALTEALPQALMSSGSDNDNAFTLNILDVIERPAQTVSTAIGVLFSQRTEGTALFHSLKEQIIANSEHVHENVKKNALPEDLEDSCSAGEIIQYFLRDTCLKEFFSAEVPFSIPERVRFEHMHIVAGSGHGKTQTLQFMIARDLQEAITSNKGFAVIDSQGDLIRNILRLKAVGDLGDRVILLDPNDLAFPLALNMFDVGLSRLGDIDPVAREKIVIGTIDLYAYIFSSLLGAELTQKQGVIFTYLARMMMVIPDATIYTLRELVEDGSQFRQYFSKLDPSSRHFFETQFFTKTFSATRQQVLTRLWGVLSNSVFERMFSAKQNKIDLFEAMNSGKIVLINTAKDLLQADGCSIFGRFFIALIAQAALSRSILPPEKRTPFFVYIDEAHDYFDERIEDIANQARKYSVGMILSHQNLDQASTKLRASIISSTSIKLAGGVSAKDAQILAQNMHTKPEMLLSAKKRSRSTQFACYIRNVVSQPVMLSVPFGVMENMPQQSEEEMRLFIDANRKRVSDAGQENGAEDLKESEVMQDQKVGRTDDESVVNQSTMKGKGGARHKEIQALLKDAAHAVGLGARVEEHIGNGAHVDLVISASAGEVACEISVSTSVEHEMRNLQKCIDAGYTSIMLICDDPNHLVKMQKVVDQADFDAGLSITFYTPEEAQDVIGKLFIKANQLTVVRGRKVKTKWSEIGDQEIERREVILAKIIADV